MTKYLAYIFAWECWMVINEVPDEKAWVGYVVLLVSMLIDALLGVVKRKLEELDV